MMTGAIFDKLVAASAGMPAAIYFLGSMLAWYRVFNGRKVSHRFVKRMTLSRAFAWTGIFLLFVIIIGARLDLWERETVVVSSLVMIINMMIFIAGLVTIRAITIGSRGNRLAIFLGTIAVFTGLLIFFM